MALASIAPCTHLREYDFSKTRHDPNSMNILLIGAGRMGIRHLRGTMGLNASVTVVDPRPEAIAEATKVHRESGASSSIRGFPHISAVLEKTFDAAILSSTAQGRLEIFQAVMAKRIPHILVEKPVEQSRARFREFLNAAATGGTTVRCDFYRRTLPFYDRFRNLNQPFALSVTGGAFGLGCNGIHWIDFAAHLSRSRKGRLLFGRIDETLIESGRGPLFGDLGGHGVFEFENGSRLDLQSIAQSSAPVVATLTFPGMQIVVDQDQDLAIIHERQPSSNMPNYRYGADYTRTEQLGVESADHSKVTQEWLQSIQSGSECRLPLLSDAAMSHELLFDLLESGGGKHFPIT